MIIKTDPAGNTVWTKKFFNEEIGYAASICQTSDGGYVFTGRSYNQGVGSGIFIQKNDSQGNLVWLKTYNPDEDFNAIANKIRQTEGVALYSW